jgi:hypothetical protein
MKETTKPNTSHILKRDLAVNIAVLPLPTPPAGARGEGRGSGARKFETRNSKSETSSKSEIQKTSNPDSESGFRRLNIEPRFGIGTSPTQHRTSNFESREIQELGNEVAGTLIDLQFPKFAEIAARRDEPLTLSQETILTLTTEDRLPNL